MPIYEYRCSNCGHLLDALQKISDAPLLRCPACDEDALKRMVSAPRFRLKGAGWYETDFKKDNRRNLAEGGEKAAEARPDAPAGDKQPAASKAPETTKAKEPAPAAKEKPAPRSE